MFLGHYGVSCAARRLGKGPPPWVWFITGQWMDIVWSVLVLLGMEKLRIVPGFTEANAYDLFYMPYTHGLPGSIVLSFVLGALVALFAPGNRATTIVLVTAASFSHWVLDLFVHVPDLPLYDNSAKVGFGLWRHVVFSFPLELIVLGLGGMVLRAEDHIRKHPRSPCMLGLRCDLGGGSGLRELRSAAKLI